MAQLILKARISRALMIGSLGRALGAVLVCVVRHDSTSSNESDSGRKVRLQYEIRNNRPQEATLSLELDPEYSYKIGVSCQAGCIRNRSAAA
jgi:hypothetical protein